MQLKCSVGKKAQQCRTIGDHENDILHAKMPIIFKVQLKCIKCSNQKYVAILPYSCYEILHLSWNC